ncbi:MAG TPA: hypothetical protein VH950_09690 [Gaiellaceae bacterium]|jgi:hypothetical protein
MAGDPHEPRDLDALERHVSEFNDLLLSSYWTFQSSALLDIIRELRHLRELVEAWSPIVGDYLANGLAEPID